MDKHIYIIHENDEWVVPLREELKKINAPYKEWHIGKDKINCSNTPPNGVFFPLPTRYLINTLMY